jgi:hypothetical protein
MSADEIAGIILASGVAALFVGLAIVMVVLVVRDR